jgi:hypothetical protein
MDEKTRYGTEDCLLPEKDISLSGKVIVLKPETLLNVPSGIRQLLFCTKEAGGALSPADRPVSAVSLSNGKFVCKKRGEVLGILKPELLPDSARLQLSQIRPRNSESQKTPEFFGYCFLPNGRYAAGVPLADEIKVREYVEIQREYQHRLMICDGEDCCVLEMLDGRLVFPTPEMLEKRQVPEASASGVLEMRL